MQTDSLFYELIRRLPSLVFELLGENPEHAGQYHFSSVEIKQTSFRADGVLRPDEETPERPIYFLEVQFQPKPDFYWRLFAEIFLFLEQEKPASNWHAVALFARRSLDPGVPVQYESLKKDHLSIVYLNEPASVQESGVGLSLVELIMAPEDEAIEKARRLRERLQQGSEKEPGTAPMNREINREMMELLETILIYKFPTWSREEIEAMFELKEIRQTRVFQEALEEGERKGKRAGKREGKREGERKGKREGEREGERKGKLKTVPLLVQFGMNVERIAQELDLDVESVREAAAKAPAIAVDRNGSSQEPG